MVYQCIDEHLNEEFYQSLYGSHEEYFAKLMELLGDDEDEAIAIMLGADEEHMVMFDEIYEEMAEKFKSDKMEEAFAKMAEMENS